MIVRKEKKWNPFLVKISALLATGKQNILHLLPLVSEKYFLFWAVTQQNNRKTINFRQPKDTMVVQRLAMLDFFFFVLLLRAVFLSFVEMQSDLETLT